MRRNVTPAIAVLCFAIATSSQAAYTRFAPEGDDPTPLGWLLVKIPPPQNAVHLIGEGVTGDGGPLQTPSPSSLPTIYANFNLQQFWLRRDTPTFKIQTFDTTPSQLVSFHSLQAEIDAGLEQVFLDPGAYLPLASFSTNGHREFTMYQDGYSRTTIVPVGSAVGVDYDQDADADGADFLAWQRNDRSAASLAMWRNAFPRPASGVAGASAVPEPAAATLAVASVLALLAARAKGSAA